MMTKLVPLPAPEIYGEQMTDPIKLQAAVCVGSIIRAAVPAVPKDFLVRQIVAAIDLYEACRMAAQPQEAA